MKRTCALATFLALAAGAAPAAQEGPWPAPVEGWGPPQPGEHPRLFFRRSDLPALEERARTPEGQAILKRLRFLLNGGDGETMPRAVLDRIAGYAVFRNAWKDGDDVVVTALLGKGPRGYKKVPGGPILVWGLGMRTRFPVDLGGTEADFFEARPAGGVLSAPVRGGTCSFAADFSGASGASAVLVMAGPDAGDVRSPQARGPGGASAASVKVAAGGHTFYVMTLQKGAAPEVKTEGDRVKVGPQTVAFDGKEITFE